MGQQFLVPQRRAFLSRRTVAATRVGTGIAKSHWHNRDPASIVKSLFVDSHPFAESLTTCIVPRNSSGVNPRPGGLSNEKEACSWRRAQNRAGPQGKRIRANTAAAYFAQQFVEGIHELSTHSCHVGQRGRFSAMAKKTAYVVLNGEQRGYDEEYEKCSDQQAEDDRDRHGHEKSSLKTCFEEHWG